MLLLFRLKYYVMPPTLFHWHANLIPNYYRTHVLDLTQADKLRDSGIDTVLVANSHRRLLLIGFTTEVRPSGSKYPIVRGRLDI